MSKIGCPILAPARVGDGWFSNTQPPTRELSLVSSFASNEDGGQCPPDKRLGVTRTTQFVLRNS